MVQTVSKDKQDEFSKGLIAFFERYPEFSSNQSHLQYLCYCFDHYINYDPSTRYLPLQEKIRRAGEMAIKFLDIVIGPKT